MSVTLRFTQLKRKKRKDGSIPIYLRITENGRSRYLSSGISIQETEWNPKKETVRKSHPLSVKYNAELTKFKIKAEGEKSELRQDGELGASTLKDRLNFNKNIPLGEYGKKYREQLKENDRYWEHKHFGVLLNDLGKMGLLLTPVSRIDQKFIEDFKEFLFNEIGNANNTVRKKLQRLKGLTNQAIKDGYLSNDPFQFVESIKRESSTKAKLSVEQIEKIKDLPLKKGSFQWHVRNYFLFSYEMAGIRFSDLCTLTPDNLIDGRLRYSMNKTGTEKSIKLRPAHFDILSHYNTESEEYIFPLIQQNYTDEFALKRKISSKNVLVNKALKTIADKAGIKENISFHVSRHSFAHNALKKGIDLYAISKALGHSGLKITEQYLKNFDEEMLDTAMDKFYA
ncbi:MAG: site-specific integrase [Balneola sp.]